MSPDERGLLNTVLESPADDTPRLVLADWYEENGQASRAKFIRAQIELARLVADEAYDTEEYVAASRAASGFPNAAYIGWVRKAGLPMAGGAIVVDFQADQATVRDPTTGTRYTLQRGFIQLLDVPRSHARDVLPLVRLVPTAGFQIDTGQYLRSHVHRFGVAVERTDAGWQAVAELSATISRRRHARTDQLARATRDELFESLPAWVHRFWADWAAVAAGTINLPRPGARTVVTTGQILFTELHAVTADLNPHPLAPRDAP